MKHCVNSNCRYAAKLELNALLHHLMIRFMKAIVFSLMVLNQACSPGETGRTFAVATGGPAGLYYPYGGGMASIWSKHLEHVNAKAEVTGGSVTNVIQVARKESDIQVHRRRRR